MNVLTYDELLPEKDAATKRRERLRLTLLPLLFGLFGLIGIFGFETDNMIGPATSALPAAGNIANNFLGWFQRGFWYLPNTPAPLYYTMLAAVFRVFGYAPSHAMAVTCVLSALGCLSVGAILSRRFGLLAGLAAQFLYVTNPLMVQLSLSSGYYIWGLAPVFFGIDLLDRYHFRRQNRFYFLAAAAFLCSGMCRPENFVLALAPIVLVPAPLFRRIGFCAIIASYPALNTLYTFVFNLRVPNSGVGRQVESLGAVFHKWIDLSWHLLVKNQVGAHWVVLGFVMLIWGGTGRTRFLACLGALLWPFFCALDLTSWGEPYMAHHYYLVSAFLLLFAAAGVSEGWNAVSAAAQRFFGVAGKRAACALMVVLLVAAWTPVTRGKAIHTALKGQIRSEAREARAFLLKTATPSEGIVVDYSSEVTWLFSELHRPQRYLWAYYLLHGPRPFDGVRSDPESVRAMNAFIAKGFLPWFSKRRPAWLITPSEREWRAKGSSAHYLSYSLRGALDPGSFHDGGQVPLGTCTAVLKRAYENSVYSVYRLEYLQTATPLAGAPPVNTGALTVVNGDFGEVHDSGLPGWALVNAKAARVTDDNGKPALELSAVSADKNAGISQEVSLPEGMAGRKCRVTIRAWSRDPDKAGLNLYYYAGGERKVQMLRHPGDGEWHDLTANVAFPAVLDPQPIELLISNRAGASVPARFAFVSLVLEP